MLTRWTQRLQTTLDAHRRRPPAEAPASSVLRTVLQRTEVFPPERLYRLSRWRGGVRQWLNTGWDLGSAAPTSSEPQGVPVADIRSDFLAALSDIDTGDAQSLRARIERARSPRELWHLRSSVYTLIATRHSESLAASRMERLNRHFPVRTLCAGFWSR